MAGFGIGAGITQQVRPAQQQPMAGGGGGQEEVAEGEDPNSQAVTPEEQAEYDQFVNNGLELIYPQGERGQMSKAVQAHLQGQYEPEIQQIFQQIEPPLNPASPIDNIAATSALIVVYLEDTAEQAGKQLDDGVVYHGGSEIVQVLANDGESAGFFSVEEKDIENAFYRAVDVYRNISPRVDQDALAGEFGQIVEADKAGQLDKALPGIGGAMTQREAA